MLLLDWKERQGTVGNVLFEPVSVSSGLALANDGVRYNKIWKRCMITTSNVFKKILNKCLFDS